MLKEGLTYISSEECDTENCAAAVGSGNLNVYATPSMIALMENAAMNCVAPYLESGASTVGFFIDVKHNRATPPGETIDAKAELTAVDGRKLAFRLEASDSKGPIGEGIHERFIVDIERFLSKL